MTPTLCVRLLGEFQIEENGTPLAGASSARLQALLAYLLLHRGAPQSRAHVAFQFWPDSSEAQAQANLRFVLHQLRRAIPDAEQYLQADKTSIVWRADAPCTLDVAAFEAALRAAAPSERGGAAAGAGRAAQDADALARAVTLYAGDLLPSCYDDWIIPERERLRAALLDALERLSRWYEQQGDYLAAIGCVQRLLRHDPLREATYRQLMRLHALSGDRTGALHAYRTCQTVLERELGVEPSQATRETYERLMQAEVAPAAGRPPAADQRPLPAGAGQAEAEPPVAIRHPSSATQPPRHNLPLQLTSFIGREHELRELRQLLPTTRLLTLTGAGGTGKTRLSLQLAAEALDAYTDGVWFVELAPLADPSLVPATVATVLGVRDDPDRPLLATLLDWLRPKQLLLILDNCEHLIDGCAQFADAVLHAGRETRILASSREALGIAGETTYRVPSLPVPDLSPERAGGAARPVSGAELIQYESVRLFAERAQAAQPHFRLTDANALPVAQICQRLDGIPLAIELAAARVKTLAAAQITARLDDRFRLLTSGSRTALPRQQTLRGTIDWSYSLLSEAERVLLRRLSAFAGGWTLEAAEAVCSTQTADGGRQTADEGERLAEGSQSVEAHQPRSAVFGLPSDDVLDLLSHLVDKSLVVLDEQAAEPCYRMLETIRQYAREKLLDAAEGQTLHDRHLDYFVRLGEIAEQELSGRHLITWLDRIERDLDNVRIALDWSKESGRSDDGLRLAGALLWFWNLRGYQAEGLERLQALLDCSTPSANTRARVDALLAAANIHWRRGSYAEAWRMAEDASAASSQFTDPLLSARVPSLLGMIADSQGRYEAAQAYLASSLTHYRFLHDKSGIMAALVSLGWLSFRRRDYAEAEGFLIEGYALALQLEDRNGSSSIARRIGWARLHVGDSAGAGEKFRESLRGNFEIGDKQAVAACFAALGALAMADEEPVRAAQLFGASDALCESIHTELLPIDRDDYKHNVATLQAQLDESSFNEAWQAGRALTLEQAIQLAMSDD